VTVSPVATASEAGVEHRSAPRRPASTVPGIKGVRLSPHGSEATLMNISASGILVECTSRLRLGTAVTTVFDGTFSPATIEGRVARSSVANVSKKGVLQYHIGIAFNKPIALEAAPVEAAVQQPETPAAPPAQVAQETPGAPGVLGAPGTTAQAPEAAPVLPILGNRW
jgi:PilZ domain-containing protein